MPHRKKLNATTEELICEAYSAHGRTLRELACFHNVSIGTIRNLLVRRGVPRRAVGRQKGKKYETQDS